jgi:hypothetical protein
LNRSLSLIYQILDFLSPLQLVGFRMASAWATFQEPPSLLVEFPSNSRWPESEQDEGYDAEQPWRLFKYNPYSNGKGLDDDIVGRNSNSSIWIPDFLVTWLHTINFYASPVHDRPALGALQTGTEAMLLLH